CTSAGPCRGLTTAEIQPGRRPFAVRAPQATKRWLASNCLAKRACPSSEGVHGPPRRFPPASPRKPIGACHHRDGRGCPERGPPLDLPSPYSFLSWRSPLPVLRATETDTRPNIPTQ